MLKTKKLIMWGSRIKYNAFIKFMNGGGDEFDFYSFTPGEKKRAYYLRQNRNDLCNGKINLEKYEKLWEAELKKVISQNKKL